MTYGAGVAQEANLILDWMKYAEMKKKAYPKTCQFYGCPEKHVTTKAKGCKYNRVKNDDELKDRIQNYLEETYPAHYGECRYPIQYQQQLIWLPQPPKYSKNRCFVGHHLLFMSNFFFRKIMFVLSLISFNLSNIGLRNNVYI